MTLLAPAPLSAGQTGRTADEARIMSASETGQGSVGPVQKTRQQAQPPGASDGGRHIRVRNASAVDFDDVRIFFPDHPAEAASYGAVKRGAASDYKAVGRAYRYAHIEAAAGDRQFILRPMDYVGEAELPAGWFTYELRITGDRLSVDLTTDD